jgi:hypothetical protein
VSSKRWGDGGRKNGEDKQPSISLRLVLESCPESAETCHGRDALNFSRQWQLYAVSGQSGGGCEGGLARSMAG